MYYHYVISCTIFGKEHRNATAVLHNHNKQFRHAKYTSTTSTVVHASRACKQILINADTSYL
jgi:hypothetical protein